MPGIPYVRYFHLLTILCNIAEGKLLLLLLLHFSEIDSGKEMGHALLEIEKVKKEEAFFTEINGSLKD